MHTNDEKGRKIAIMMCFYFAAKWIINMIVGGGFDFSGMLTVVAIAFLLISGMQYVNYAAGILIAIPVILNLPNNITHLPENTLYLIEAILDVGCIVILIAQKNVRNHFSNPWVIKSE